jgi:hypothetical protein
MASIILLITDEIQIINDIVAHESIEETNDEEIAKAIRSINRGQSADYHGLTIEHIINAGKDMEHFLCSYCCVLICEIVVYLLFWFSLSVPFLHPSAWPVQL